MSISIPEPRCLLYQGRTLVGVTSAIRILKWSLQEPDDYFGPEAQVHALEGTACHAVCLNWLAYTFRWIPEVVTPERPPGYPHGSRWEAVLNYAINGFTKFVEEYEIEPIAIEQESYSLPLGLVGHLDLYALIKWHKRRVRAVIDLKFVRQIQESHLLQVRCYGKLSGFADAQLGMIYQGDRESPTWRVKEISLTSGLDDVAAVHNAVKLWLWSEKKRLSTPNQQEVL